MAKTTKSLVDDPIFVADCCRFFENLTTESAMRRKYAFITDQEWERLGDDQQLLAAVEAETTRRIRSGQSKREKAQLHVVAAPDILNSIMTNASASCKARIESAKVLDTFADNGPQATPPPEMFNIVINLTAGGGERLEFSKPIRPDPPKTIEHDDDTPPILAMITANKRGDDNGGQPL
jgi:hypothetical protein